MGGRRPDRDNIDRILSGLRTALDAAWVLAERGGPDFSGTVAAALQDLSRAKGGVHVLTRSWGGSWESEHVRRLGMTEFDWGP